MAPITIATDISDVVHLVLQSYLSQTTGITDWQSFDSSLGIQTTSALSYRGSIWVNRIRPDTSATRRLRKIESTYTLRLLISSDDVDEVSVECHKWARKLSDLIESTSTLDGQRRNGADLDGTFIDLELAGATLDIQQGDWSITVEGNKDGGGVGVIQNILTVSGTL
jgi:hypothetical protein